MRTVPVLFVLIAGWSLGLASAQPAEPPAIDPLTGAVRPITFGDAAPALRPATWVQGEPVKAFAPGTVYVVWFFSSWGEKSHKAMPTLAQVQTRFKDRGVVVVGVGVWETSLPLPGHQGYEDRFTAFVKARAAELPYAVAYDGDQGEMAQTWMRGADRKSIPSAFVIDAEGKVAWMGHPLSTGEPLATVVEQVIAGTFDVRAAGAKAKAEQEALTSARKLENRLRKLMEARDGKGARLVVDELLALRPTEFTPLVREVFELLAVENKDAATAYEWLKALEPGPLKDDATTLNNVAWDIATLEGVEPRDLDLALRLANRAVTVSEWKEAFIIDTLARVQFDRGEVEPAIATQTKAVELAEPGRKTDYEATLERYKAARKP